MADNNLILMKVRIDPKTLGLTEKQIEELRDQELVLRAPSGTGPNTPLGYLGKIKKEIDELQKKQAATWDKGEIKSYTTQIRALEKEMHDLVNVEEEIKVASPFAGMLPQLTAIGAATATIGALTAGLKKGFDALVELDQGARNIGSLGVKNFERFKDEAVKLSDELPASAGDAIAQYYQAISAGVSEQDAAGFVREAAKAATAGVADLSESVNLGTTIMNAYGLAGDEIGRVFDITFTAVKNGKTDFSQLNSAMAAVIPTASAAGVTYEQVAAALASMTKQGIPTQQAATKLNQAIVEIQKPGEVLAKVIKDAGYESGVLALKQDSLQTVLDKVEKAAAKSGLTLTQVFGSVEAGSAALSLTGKNAAMAAADLADMGNSAGAAGKAFEVNSKSIGNQLQVLSNKLENTLMRAVEGLEPVLMAALDAAEPLLDVLGKFAPLAGQLVGVLAGLAAAWATYKGAVEGAKLAQDAFNALQKANPYAVAIAATAALVIGVKELADALQQTAQEKQDDLEATGRAIQKQREFVVQQRDSTKATKELADQYIVLAEKSSRTKEENAELSRISKELDEKYPGLIDNTKDYALSLDDVRKYAEGASKKIQDFNKDITQLDKDFAQNKVDRLENSVTVALKAMRESVADEERTLLNQASKSVFGFDTVQENVQKFQQSFEDAIYAAGDQPSVQKALAAFNKKVRNALDEGDISGTQAELYFEGASTVAANRIDYLTNRVKILRGEVEETKAETDNPDDPIIKPPPAKVLGEIEKLEKKIQDLRASIRALKDADSPEGLKLQQDLADTQDQLTDLNEKLKESTRQAGAERAEAYSEGFKSEIEKSFKADFGFDIFGAPEDIDITNEKINKSYELLGRVREKLEQFSSDVDIGVSLADLAGMSDEDLQDLENRIDTINEAFFQIGQVMTDTLTNALKEGQPALKALFKSMLVGVLEYLKRYILLVELKTTLDELLTKGPIGFLTAGLITGALEGLFSLAQAAVTGFGTGGVIVGERGPEVIAPAKEFSEFAGQIVAAAVRTLREATQQLSDGRADSRRIAVSNSLEFKQLEVRVDHDATYYAYEIRAAAARFEQLGGH